MEEVTEETEAAAAATTRRDDDGARYAHLRVLPQKNKTAEHSASELQQEPTTNRAPS